VVEEYSGHDLAIPARSDVRGSHDAGAGAVAAGDHPVSFFPSSTAPSGEHRWSSAQRRDGRVEGAKYSDRAAWIHVARVRKRAVHGEWAGPLQADIAVHHHLHFAMVPLAVWGTGGRLWG
jgi:hypothetical protein